MSDRDILLEMEIDRLQSNLDCLYDALRKALAQLEELTPLLQTDESGNGPDSTEHFQTIIDGFYALSVAHKELRKKEE